MQRYARDLSQFWRWSFVYFQKKNLPKDYAFRLDSSNYIIIRYTFRNVTDI